MVNDPNYTTLWEGWVIGKGFGVNHAWSGGMQIVISQYLFGIKPLEAGYKTFLVAPDPVYFSSASISIPTIQGMVRSSFEKTDDGFTMKLSVPLSG